MPQPSLARRLALAALAAVAAIALTAPAASADDPDLLTACTHGELGKPFLPWLDPMDYELIPGGTFEGGLSGWRLDGAWPVGGNEPFYAHGEGDRRSLVIAAGGSVRTPTVCTGLSEPTLRFFARSSEPTAAAPLAVRVLFRGADGTWFSLPIGWVTATGDWHATRPHPVIANLLAELPGVQAQVAFELEAVGDVAWQVDDLYLDPYRRS